MRRLPPPPAPGELPVPAGITCDPAETSLSFAWNAVANAATYAIEFKDAESAVVTASVSSASWAKEDLVSESNYEFRVKSCPAADSKKYLESQWSEWMACSTSEGLIARKFSAGDGTENNPYIIKTAAQLALLAKMVNEEEAGYCEYGVYYELGADIDLKNYAEWTPIGIGTGSQCIATASPSIMKGFRGNFSGASHKITNLNVVLSGDTAEIYAGLFGLNAGWIEFVTVEGNVSAKSMYAEGGMLMAGGVCGFSGIAYGAGGVMEPLAQTGGLVSTSFKGNVTADSNMDVGGSAVAAGICGYANSGNIDNAIVTLEKGMAIHAFAGATPTAAGVIGYQDAGRLKDATVTVAGDIVAEYLAGAQIPKDDGVYAGGVLGCCYRLQDANNAPGLYNCNVNVSGNIKALARGGGSGAYAGALGGRSAADMCVSCTADVTGNIVAEGEAVVAAGGLLGTSTGAMGLCSVDLKGEVSAKQTSASVELASASFSAGGLVGNASGEMTWCSAVVDGKISVSNASTEGHLTNCGVLAGSSTAVYGSYAILSKNAVIEMAAKTINFGGIAGFFGGNNTNKYLANYSFMEGAIKTHPAPGGGEYSATVGGIAGYMNGARVGTKFQSAPMYACYSVFKSAVGTDAAVTLKKGAIAANGQRFMLGSNYWWSTDSSLFGFGADTADSATDGVIKFASLDKAGFEAALPNMNEALTNNGATVLYQYDAVKGYPVVITGAGE